jgi:hypothetical protein
MCQVSGVRCQEQGTDVLGALEPVVGLQVSQMRAVKLAPQRRGGLHARAAAAFEIVTRVADEDRLARL